MENATATREFSDLASSSNKSRFSALPYLILSLRIAMVLITPSITFEDLIRWNTDSTRLGTLPVMHTHGTPLFPS